MHDVNLAVVAEVKNLRSQVAREAIKLMRTLFKNLDKRMDLVSNSFNFWRYQCEVDA